MKTRERALNAAACINNYTPSSLNELIRNNKIFQGKDVNPNLLFAAKSVDNGQDITFTLEDIFDGVVTKDMVSDIRIAHISDRNYPRIREG